MSSQAIIDDKFQELVRLIRAQGWRQKAPVRSLLELSLHVSLCLGGITIAAISEHMLVQAAALLVSSIGATGISTNTHTSSHFATSNWPSLDRALTYFGYTFFFGTSATYWWYKHCIVHHPTPNMIGIDADADLMPWFALNEDEFKNSRGLRRFFYRMQWLVIPFAIAFNAFNIQVSGWRYLLPTLCERQRRRARHWVDLCVLFLHWGVWLFAPMLFFDPLHVVVFHVIRLVLLGYAMFIAFAPAHFPEEAAFADKSQKNEDFVLRQTATTVNFRTGLVGRLICAGVEYQIEHHLFPGVHHMYYPQLSRLVEKFCRENGYPYQTLGWGEATWKSLLAFRKPKKVLGELKALRHESVKINRGRLPSKKGFSKPRLEVSG